MSDFDFDQDDFFEDYEEEEEESTDSDSEEKAKTDEPEREVLSPEEQDRRVAAFQKLQKRNMHIAVKPKQFKPEQRKEAIRWLGEAGDPTSIPALLKVYQKDKTPGMKEEAAYALGQIKAMGRALEDPEMEDKAYDLLNHIVLYNEFGKRANTGRFKLIEIGLGISAVALFVIGFLAMLAVAIPRNNANATEAAITAAYETDIAPTWTPDNDETVTASLETYYSQLNTDADNYRLQLLAAGREESINCEADFFNKPEQYTLTDTWLNNAEYVAIAEKLNAIYDALLPVRQAYDESCSSLTPITREETLSLGTMVLDSQNLLREAAPLLEGSGLVVPTLVPTDTPVPDPTDIPPPTATPDLAQADDAIIQLENIVSDMTGPRGTANNLVFYWEQVVASNQMYREGCAEGSMSIPAEYVLPAELQGAFPRLEQTILNINTGLATMRDSSTSFFNACNDGSVPADAANQLTLANLAKSAFLAAQVELDGLQGQ